MSSIKKIRESETNSTFLIEFDTSDIDFKYKTMNNLLLFPENNPGLVESFAESQSWELDKTFILKYDSVHKPKLPFPLPITIKEALTKFCDLNEPLS